MSDIRDLYFNTGAHVNMSVLHGLIYENSKFLISYR